MQMEEGVENGCPALLLPSPKGVLGLTTISQYIYVFFPQKIRVYEQLPSRPNPELVEEIYLSKKNICRFAVSQQYIAVLFQDSALEVRLREYWEVVQYSSSLSQQSSTIDSLQIDANKVYYRFKKDQQNHPTFGFVDLTDKVQQIQYWQQTKPLQKLIHRHKLGSIPDFYVSLIENQIRFGMYYQEQPTVLKQFQFGTLNEPYPDNKVLSVHLLQSQEIRKENQSEKKDLFLVKLVEESHAKKQKEVSKKKNKNKDKANSSANSQDSPKLTLRYIKFFEEEIHYPSQEENITAEDKKFKVFEEMLHSMQQIQGNTNCEKSDFFGNFTNQQQPVQYPQKQKQNEQWKHFDLPISPHQLQFFDIIRKGSTLYLNTGSQIYSFCFKQGPNLQLIQQFDKQQEYYKVKDICQHGLILYGQALFTMPFLDGQKKKQEQQGKKIEGAKKQFPREKSRQSSGSKEENNKQVLTVPSIQKINTCQTHMQTEVPTDVFLDQFEQQQLTQIIDKLFEKKKVLDQQTATQPISYSIWEVQTDPIDLKEQQTQEDRPIAYMQFDKKIEKTVKIEKTRDQQIQITPEKVQTQEICIGESLPLCPQCHHINITAISKSLKNIEDHSGPKWTELVCESIKKEQQKMKNDVVTKIKSIVDSVIGEKVIPMVEANVKAILDQKLAQINSYIYSLAMNNLMTLNQELQKDVVKENSIRNDLLKKQMHEISENKKAVAQMVEICKVRQIQKMVFFENIEKKFNQIDDKVKQLQEKVKGFASNEEVKDESLQKEIEYIKSMLLEEMNQEDSDIESQREQDLEESEEGEDEVQEEGEISQEEQNSSQDGYEESIQVHHKRHIMENPTRIMHPHYSSQQPYWQQPPPYPYYPQQYAPYQQQPNYYMPPPPYQGYPPHSPFQHQVFQAPVSRPSKKLRLPPSEKLETYSIPMEVLKAEMRPLKKKRKLKD